MKRMPIQLPTAAPPGGRSRKASTAGPTPPGTDRGTPDKSSKPSSATTSMDELAAARRPSAWTTRPSMMGMMAANRMGMGLLRKLRNSQGGSKRESTCGERAEPPPPPMEPTYRLEPKTAFIPTVVEAIIKSSLDDQLSDRSYRPKHATMLCRILSDELRDKVKKLGYDRYRCVVSVVMGERKDQGVQAASRCSWDDKRDNFASYTFTNKDIFCTASVYGVYKE